MRRFVLHRSATALAVVGLTAAVLAAIPATAATTPGVTREMIRTAAQGLRTTDPSQAQKDALNSIIRLHCGADPTVDSDTWPAAIRAAGGVDGVLVSSYSYEPSLKHCIFAALTPVDPTAELSGSVTITQQPIASNTEPVVTPLVTEQLSGGVFLTSSISERYGEIRMTTSGETSKVVTARTTIKVKDPKSRAQKKSAKKKYVKRLRAAKTSYAAALAKAGRSTSKKQAARTKYARKRAAAKAQYRRAIAGHRLVTRISTRRESAPFSAAAVAYSLIRFG